MSLRGKCSTCRSWWPNTPKGVVAEANRRVKNRCLHSPNPWVGPKKDSCRFYKGFKPFFMVPWDEKTWIKVEADSRNEMLEKVGVIAHKIAGELTEAILKENRVD